MIDSKLWSLYFKYVFKKRRSPIALRIKNTIFLTLNTKKKAINLTRTFKIYSEWHLCCMFKSSMSLLAHFKFSKKIYKLLTKQNDKLPLEKNRSLTLLGNFKTKPNWLASFLLSKNDYL